MVTDETNLLVGIVDFRTTEVVDDADNPGNTMFFSCASMQILQCVAALGELILANDERVADALLVGSRQLLIELAARYIDGHIYTSITQLGNRLLRSVKDIANQDGIQIGFRRQ